MRLRGKGGTGIVLLPPTIITPRDDYEVISSIGVILKYFKKFEILVLDHSLPPLLSPRVEIFFDLYLLGI